MNTSIDVLKSGKEPTCTLLVAKQSVTAAINNTTSIAVPQECISKPTAAWLQALQSRPSQATLGALSLSVSTFFANWTFFVITEGWAKFFGTTIRELPDKLNGIKEYIIGMHDCRRPIHFLDVRIKLGLQDLRRSPTIKHHHLMTLLYIYNSVYTHINGRRVTSATVEMAAALEDWVASRCTKSHVAVPKLVKMCLDLKRLFGAVRSRKSTSAHAYMYDDAVKRFILMHPSKIGSSSTSSQYDSSSFVDMDNAQSFVYELQHVLQVSADVAHDKVNKNPKIRKLLGLAED